MENNYIDAVATVLSVMMSKYFLIALFLCILGYMYRSIASIGLITPKEAHSIKYQSESRKRSKEKSSSISIRDIDSKIDTHADEVKHSSKANYDDDYDSKFGSFDPVKIKKISPITSIGEDDDSTKAKKKNSSINKTKLSKFLKPFENVETPKRYLQDENEENFTKYSYDDEQNLDINEKDVLKQKNKISSTISSSANLVKKWFNDRNSPKTEIPENQYVKKKTESKIEYQVNKLDDEDFDYEFQKMNSQIIQRDETIRALEAEVADLKKIIIDKDKTN